MQTQTQTKTALNANLSELPILKHFEKNEIATKVDTFRKGEKNLFWFFKLAALVGVGYLTWTYVLPPVFQAIGQMLAVAATGIMIVAGIIMAPVVVKGIRAFTRFVHKALIKHDPFAQLETERYKMEQNKQTFILAKSKINQIKDDMRNESEVAQREAEKGQKDVLKKKAEADKIKTEMDDMVKKMGKAAESEDSYIQLASDFQKVNAEALRIVNKMNQSSDFVQKYGTRFNIMKKMSQKLTLVETAMDIKIADFDATIEMLKKDYEFGRKANQATTAAKSAMLFSKGWEFDYALEVVTSTIAADIAITSSNLKDINTITANYSLDSDDLYNNLNEVADKIKTGAMPITEAKQYNNPNYKLTQSDVSKSGGFGDLF